MTLHIAVVTLLATNSNSLALRMVFVSISTAYKVGQKLSTPHLPGLKQGNRKLGAQSTTVQTDNSVPHVDDNANGSNTAEDKNMNSLSEYAQSQVGKNAHALTPE